jgi:TolA-binding protein
VVRGELTAAQDCRAALQDFAAVSDKVPPEVAERALYGKGACQAQLGDRADAAASFRAYLQRFPGGRFAAEARRQIEDRSK